MYGGRTELTEVPGTGMAALQNLEKIRVRVWKSYKTHRSSGYGYGSLADLREDSGTGMEVLQNSQKFRVRDGHLPELTEVPDRYPNVVPVPRVLWHGRTELTEVPGRVGVWKPYRT